MKKILLILFILIILFVFASCEKNKVSSNTKKDTYTNQEKGPYFSDETNSVNSLNSSNITNSKNESTSNSNNIKLPEVPF